MVLKDRHHFTVQIKSSLLFTRRLQRPIIQTAVILEIVMAWQDDAYNKRATIK